MGQGVFIDDLLMGGFSIVVRYNAVDGSRGAVGLTESDSVGNGLLSPAAAVANSCLNPGIVLLSETLDGLGVNNALLDAHLVQLLEIAFWVPGLALLVHLP